MSTRIDYDQRTKPIGSKLNYAVGLLILARQEFKILKEVFDSAASGGTWTGVESEIGNAGDGQTVYNIIAGTLSDLNGATFNDLSRLYKG